ncbi:MAG TPA: hypothetical protein VH518_22995 [Tepidisphaeraceae bacterium]
MKSIFRLIVCLLLLVGWGLAALSLHVIRTPAEIPITLVPKENFSVRDTYVDTTKWSIDDVGKHPALVEKLVRTGKADVLQHVIPDKNADASTQLSDALVREQRRERDREREHDHKSTQPTTIGQIMSWF